VGFVYGNLAYTERYTQTLLTLVQLYQEEYPTPSAKLQNYIETIDLDFLIEDLPQILNSMKVGAERIHRIVLSLRIFSRLNEADIKRVDLHEGIDSTLLILQSRLKADVDHSKIKVVKEYGDLPLVECFAGKLNQVFMNILSNAIDAIAKPEAETIEQQVPRQGQITIRTEKLGDHRVRIRIADNGVGMSETVKARLFDPFFTTKPVGKGTGLGLSICYEIVVKKHRGILKCSSEPGEGAEFWIELPIQQRLVNPD
jgi:signal transduction histidine kinase